MPPEVANDRSFEQRRQLAGVLSVLTVLFAMAGWAWLRSPDAATETPVSVSTPTVDTTTVSATSGPSASGIEVGIETNREVLVGTRTSVRVTILNNGVDTVYWEAGGCGIPAVVMVQPGGFDESVGSSIKLSWDPAWDGNLDSLGGTLRGLDDSVLAFGAQPASTIGLGEVGCPLISMSEAFEPGDVLTYEASAEIRVPTGPLPGDGTYEFTARFDGHRTYRLDGADALEPVEARVSVAVVDHPARTIAGVDELVSIAVADGRLVDWLPTTAVLGQPELRQSFRVGLTWWRGAWELWVDPKYGSGSGAFRLRLDPATESATDARLVAFGAVPEDEPEAEPSMSPPDKILGRSTEPDPPSVLIEPATARIGDTITVVVDDPGIEVCNTMAIIYEVTGDATRTSGILLDSESSATEWIAAPEAIPMTIPPCMPTAAAGAHTYTVPNLAPASYLVCLTRDTDACGTITIID